MAAPVVAAVAMAITAVATLVGKAIAEGKSAQAEKIMKQAAEEFNIPLPDFQALVAEELGASDLGSIKHDPELIDAQMQAFDTLGQIQDSGGLTLQDETALNRIQNDVARQQKSARGQITNEMAQRGTLGSGAELAMKLQNEQMGAQRNAEAGMDTAAQAQQRYWDSVLAQSDVAGQIRGQNWGEQSEVAKANDAIKRYNAGARTDAHKYNNSLRQDQFNNTMGRAQARVDVARLRSNAKLGEASDAAQFYGNVGKAGSEAVMAFGAQDDDEDDE